MPDDLLHFVFGPQPYSVWWLCCAVLLLLSVICWYVGIFVWTLPSQRLRRVPVVRRAHAWFLRNRYARSVQHITDDLAAQRISMPAASAAISRTVRSFLHQATGTRAQYLHVAEIADGNLAAAAPLLDQLADAQFNVASHVDLTDVGTRAQELIRSWT